MNEEKPLEYNSDTSVESAKRSLDNLKHDIFQGKAGAWGSAVELHTQNWHPNPPILHVRRPTLDELAHQEKVPELWSDKRSRTHGTAYVGHDYLRFYDREWTKWRDEPIRLVEIGLNVGASIKLWQQYFSQATIFGVDICKFEDKVGIPDPKRFVFYQADQSDDAFWQEFANNHPGGFAIIIDDGSHFSGPIINSFRSMWRHVNPGGYYVIEDLGEVRNLESHTRDYPDQLEFCRDLMGKIILGENDIEEAFVSKELVMLRKKV